MRRAALLLWDVSVSKRARLRIDAPECSEPVTIRLHSEYVGCRNCAWVWLSFRESPVYFGDKPWKNY